MVRHGERYPGCKHQRHGVQNSAEGGLLEKGVQDIDGKEWMSPERDQRRGDCVDSIPFYCHSQVYHGDVQGARCGERAKGAGKFRSAENGIVAVSLSSSTSSFSC